MLIYRISDGFMTALDEVDLVCFLWYDSLSIQGNAIDLDERKSCDPLANERE